MFKKLKEKITEEVKSSPQRFQQLTQTVSDKLQGSNSTDENFFSIGEDDATTSNTNIVDQGFSSVALVSPSSEDKMRRSSISSLASDISFLPKYESGNFYHLQSDLDVSASEIEDNISQSSSNVGRVSKEQLYSAFKKSQMQYHKYRGRYTDLARHYKELEREISKMKAVLVETQDKSIRRVTELKEQCALEQKAKAHLEGALRDELDEKQMKIQSLQTKINLLQSHNGPESLIELDKGETTENHVDSEKFEQLTKYLTDARNEIEALNSKIQEYKANVIVFQSKEQEYKNKIIFLEKDIVSFSDREKENNIKLAENKMELHNELLNKDSEINRLKKDIELFKANLNTREKDGKSVKLENLQIQNSKLIERVETLTQKCNGLENDLLKVEKYKIRIRELTEQNLQLNKITDENKDHQANLSKLTTENNELCDIVLNLKQDVDNVQDNLKRLAEEKSNLIETIEKNKNEYETELITLRENAKKGLFSLEKQISDKLQTEFKEREEQLKEEFARKIEEISLNHDTVKEIHLKLLDKESSIKVISEELEQVRENLTHKENNFAELENNHLQLIEESNELRKTVTTLEKQVIDITKETSKSAGDAVKKLQNNIQTLENEIEHIQKMCKEKDENNIQLAKEILNLESANAELLEKVRLVEEKQEAIEMEPTENNLLEIKVQYLEQEKLQLLENFEQERKVLNKMLKENKELKVKDIKIGELQSGNHKLQEKVVRLKGYLKDKESSNVQLHKIKLDLEHEITKLKESVRILEEQEEAIEIDKTECNLLQIKVQQLENEKETLIKSFERERDVFNQSFHQKNEQFDLHKEEIMNENISLAKENLQLKSSNEELMQQNRLFEERDQVIELETSECNLLKTKLQELERENQEIVQGFEMEREMFNKILVEHKELKLKEEHIKVLEGSNKHLTEKVAELKEYLKKKDSDIVVLHKVKLILEEDIAQLKESLRIHQEKIQALEVEDTECNILEMKVQALEEERQSLLNSFELERKTFEEALVKTSRIKSELEDINRENTALKEELDKLYENDKKTQNEIASVSSDSNKKAITIQEQEQLINALREKNNNLLSDLERKNAENQEAFKEIESIKQQLHKDHAEKEEIKRISKDLENLYDERKLDTQALEEKSKKLEEMTNQKLLFEKELEKKTEEYNFKNKEINIIEHQFNILTQDKENLLAENKSIKVKLEDIAQEYEYLKGLVPKVKELDQAKKHNEILQEKYDKLNQEISELKVRLNQLTSDNRNINEDHEKLIVQFEEHKAKNEFLEKENENLQNVQLKMEQDKSALQDSINDLTEKLKMLQKDYQDLNNASPKPVHSELETLQKDFYELKEKCDSLYVENKNSKQEYEKLQEQCDNFSKMKKDLNSQLVELECHYNEVLHEKQLLQDEVQELKSSPINAGSTNTGRLENLTTSKQEALLSAMPHRTNTDIETLQKEIDNLSDKLTQYKSLDITNKSSIEFYENELQKMKNKNEKLNRKLDETLVTLNHCAELSSSTEIEYLRNVLYNYMLGKESLVLARVIAAVCKFDSNQTEAVLQKEQQKQTLLGQLGIL